MRTEANGGREVQGIPVVPNVGNATTDVVAWPSIAEVNVLEAIGDLGADAGFCDHMPDAVAAAIRYSDGHQDRRQLIDTTDQGLEGIGERGRISIPLRNIAKLRVIDDQNWDWVTKYKTDPLERDRARNKVTLRTTSVDGRIVELNGVDFYAAKKEKISGNKSLLLPVTREWEFVVWIAGARISLAWNDLKSVDIDHRDALTARVTYADGRSETAEVEAGKLNTTSEGGRSVDLADVRRIDIRRDGP